MTTCKILPQTANDDMQFLIAAQIEHSGPLTIKQLKQKLPGKAYMVGRHTRALVKYGILKQVGPHKFGKGPKFYHYYNFYKVRYGY